MSNRPAEIWCETGLYWDYKDDWSEGSWTARRKMTGEKYVRADRIEQLAATCEELEAKLAECEARLEKATEALEGVRVFVKDLEPYADQGHTLVPALHKACETLKEIKGKDQ